MANQALLRQIAQLREEVRALSVRREVVRCPAPTLDEAREVLRILIDAGLFDLDGVPALNPLRARLAPLVQGEYSDDEDHWKGTSGDEGRGDGLRRERERGLA